MIDLQTILLVTVISTIFGYWMARQRYIGQLQKAETIHFKIQNELAAKIETMAAATLDNYKTSEEFQALLTLQYENGKNQGSARSLTDYKTSEEFAAVLGAEHAKGKLAGAADELNKFHITYTPVLVDHETFISHKVDAGYDMQLHYSGFPIGEPTRRITSHQEKSKDENINRMLDTVNKTLELAAAAATKQRIPVTVARTPKRVSKK
jgi:hypothetical protein